MRAHVAHSMRGRLRVRYPPAWLKQRREHLESTIRALPGVRAVQGSPVTGSVRIDYDPFQLAENAIVGTLHELSAALDPRSAAIDVASPKSQRLRSSPTAPLMNLLGASSALAAACCVPIPSAVTAGLVLASASPPRS